MKSFLLLSLLIAGSAFALDGGIVSPLASFSPFPATVGVRFPGGDPNPFCTAVKVAPHTLLTAAHCIFNEGTGHVDADFSPGRSLELMPLPNPVALVPWTPVTIDNAVLNPNFESSCAVLPCPAEVVASVAEDVALIYLREETPFIPSAVIQYNVVDVNTPVNIMGFGCENGVYGTLLPLYPAGYARLKYHGTYTQPDSIFALAGYPGAAFGPFFYTKGKAMDPGEASLCPGDSGGPVYLEDGSRMSVVGVNSSILAWDSSFQGVINQHTRLSRVKPWLSSSLR